MTNIGKYQNLGEEIAMMEVELKDLKLEHKHLMRNMHMNAPKFNGTVDYGKERVTGGQIPMTLDEIVMKQGKISERAEYLKERIDDKKSLMDEARFILGSMK
ncbi:hypothetical protein, partial [Streptococcus sobrinus]|uniref:hypothetical protein n=1 Tax=Streptococcus sobrinus TaxID=1310 RepID=UPI00036BD836